MERTLAISGVFADAFSILTGVVTAVAAGVVAWIAWKGLSTWRHEMLGRRRSELAEEVLAEFYQARDVMRWVRYPVGTGSEAGERPRTDEEDDSLSSLLDAYFVPVARLNKNRAFLAEFRARRYRFRAVFGEGSDEPFESLKSIETEIVAASRALARIAVTEHGRSRLPLSVRELTDSRLETERRRRELYESRIWGLEDEEDEIAKALDEAVEKIEAICRPAIEARAK